MFTPTKGTDIDSVRLEEYKRCGNGVSRCFTVFYVFYAAHRYVPCIVGAENNNKTVKRCETV